jgi:MFS family permease
MTTGPSITAAGAALSFFVNGTYAALYAYTPEVFPTWVRATGMGLSSAFGRIGGIIAPLFIGFFAERLGFAGVFGATTTVLAVGVLTVFTFGVSTAGQSLEALSAENDAVTMPRATAPITMARRPSVVRWANRPPNFDDYTRADPAASTARRSSSFCGGWSTQCLCGELEVRPRGAPTTPGPLGPIREISGNGSLYNPGRADEF